MTSYLEVSEPRPHVRQLTLNRPERMNAMSFDTVTPLRDALREVGEDNAARSAACACCRAARSTT